MAELYLFVIVGALSVVAAAMMLITRNTVYSALFLTLNFLCVAILFLMLEAPFLAMVQIAVYAGAIMVLFLFVIMLLGAEQATTELKRFGWFTPSVIVLSLLMLVIVGIGIGQGQIDLQEPPPQEPSVRVMHAVTAAEAVDVYAGEAQIASDVEFGEASDFLSVPAGEYEVTLTAAGSEEEIFSQAVALESDTTVTVIAHLLDGEPTLAVVENDFTTVAERNGRVMVYNAYTMPVQFVERPTEFFEQDHVLIESLAPGEVSEEIVQSERTSNYLFAEDDNVEDVLRRLNDYEIQRDTSQFIVLAEEELFNGDRRMVAVPLVSATAPVFGAPYSVGVSLLAKYVLPFEMVGILLLVAVIGAVVLTQRYHDLAVQPQLKSGRRRVVTRPLTEAVASQVGQEYTGLSEKPALPSGEERETEAGD